MTEVEAIVVGAGSAGAIVATRLAERGRRVLLLEAGPDFPGEVPALLTDDLRIPVTEHDWGYESEGDRRIPLPRGKVVGGSSATNAVAAVRPQPADLDGWGLAEWTWERCVPALCRFENDREFGREPWHGADGPIHVQRADLEAVAPVTRAAHEACLAAGYPAAPDQNAPGAHGAGMQAANVRDGVRQSTLVTYLPAARRLPGFELRPDCQVARVLLDGTRCTGIVTDRGEELRAGMVVLAAGAFATPLVLMRSGIGPAAHLREHGIGVVADLPVGEGLTDHPAMPGVLAFARTEGMCDTALWVRFMMRLSFDGHAGEEDVHVFGPFTGEAVRAPMPSDAFVIAGMVMKPRSRGWVRLRSADPADAPRVMLNYYADSADLDCAVRLIGLIHELYATPPLEEVTREVVFPAPGTDVSELRELLRAGSITDHHPASTCPIGPVVDEHLRVHGIEGLRVCDASVLPDAPRANTNFPTMMVAERFIELLDSEGR